MLNFTLKLPSLPAPVRGLLLCCTDCGSAVEDEDGNIIASGEITIDKADGDELTLTADEDGNPVIKPAKDTKDIDLTLVVGKDG